MSKVFVIDRDKRPLAPIHSAQARQLLRNKKAAIFRKFPFTLLLKQSYSDVSIQNLKVKIDPGAKTTGVAVVNKESGEVVFAAEIEHRGFQIRDALTSRRQLRRSRRNRKTRYRQPRFLNRTRAEKWLPSSLTSRVENTLTWIRRLIKFCPISSIAVELVKFDTHLMQDANGARYCLPTRNINGF